MRVSSLVSVWTALASATHLVQLAARQAGGVTGGDRVREENGFSFLRHGSRCRLARGLDMFPRMRGFKWAR